MVGRQDLGSGLAHSGLVQSLARFLAHSLFLLSLSFSLSLSLQVFQSVKMGLKVN